MSRTLRIGDREVARVGLGTNRLTLTDAHVEFIVGAVEAGVELIDTAHIYAGGQSEQTIGEALSRITSKRPMVATKGGFTPGTGHPDVLRAQIDESLRQLRVETIDLYYLHRVDPETPLEQSLGAIKEFVDRGLIRRVGLSQVDVAEIEIARSIVPIAAVQNQFNISERSWDEVVDYCARKGIAFVPFHPLHGTNEALGKVARQRKSTEQQVALAWLLKRSPAILPIPGSLSIEHVRENLGALDMELADAEFAEVSPR